MTLEEEFIPNQAIANISERFQPRFAALNASEAERAQMVEFINKMAEVATQLILQERVIQVPNSEQTIPFDSTTAQQTMTLFAEGMYLSVVKAWEMKIPEEPKNLLLQNVAQYVYDNAKQIVVSTYGQEHTPEFQLGEDQQIQMVNQTADNALLYFIGEHEKEHGPLVPQTPSEAPPAPEAQSPQKTETPPQDVPTETPPAQEEEKKEATTDQAETPPQQQQAVSAPQQQAPAAPQPHQGPHPNDKYAALGLLLTALPAAQQANILKKFSQEEQEMLHYFGNPVHVETHLDKACVNVHLQQLKKQLLSPDAEKSEARRGLEHIAHETHQTRSSDAFLRRVKHERPGLKVYLEQLISDTNAVPPGKTGLALFSESSQESASGHGKRLPQKIEALLFQHLSKKQTKNVANADQEPKQRTRKAAGGSGKPSNPSQAPTPEGSPLRDAGRNLAHKINRLRRR